MDAALHCSIISLYDLKTKLLDKCSFTTFAQCNINPIFLSFISVLRAREALLFKTAGLILGTCSQDLVMGPFLMELV